jgi:RNA polymerase sigma-70 factor, ECF subfamily
MSAVDEDALGQAFTAHRTHLIGVAYRLTSSMADAEDAVQEAWLRLSMLGTEQRAGIKDLRAWLTTVTGRICLDRLRSATVRRESYVGPWLPEPMVTPLPGQPGENPAEVIVRDDEVRMAALVVLDRLPPDQRVAFVLHDAFGCTFAEIADTLGCSVPAARQYASRGRRAVADADPPPRAALAEQQEILGQFLTAVAAGDVPAVVALLHPDAVLVGDANGKARTARRLVRGADKVARLSVGLLRRYTTAALDTARFVLVNGDLGLTIAPIRRDGARPALDAHVVTFAVRGGRIEFIYDVANPDKLTRVPV